MNQPESEPRFAAFRKRVLIGALLICLVGLPMGIMLRLPYVWSLALAGIVISTTKALALSREKRS